MADISGYLCGECGGNKFPEGLRLVLCPVCQQKIHAGCWPAHEKNHRHKDPDVFQNRSVRRGIMGAYGVIRWQSGAPSA